MTNKTYNRLLFVDKKIAYQFSDNATNYSVEKNKIDKEYLSVFEHYDTNNDGILDKNELSIFKQDINSVNSDSDKETINKKEIMNYIQNVFPEIDKTERKGFIKNVLGFVNNLQKNYRNTIVNVSDGVIDFVAQSAKTGDCWLLDKLRGLSMTSWGAKAIKESILEDKENNQYNVNLKGVNFNTTITKKDIEEARKSGKYSTGDIDALLIELATERYYQQEVDAGNIVREDNVLDGNLGSGKLNLPYLLTGKTGHSFYFSKNITKEDNNKGLSEAQKCRWRSNYDYTSNTFDKEVMKNLVYKLADSKEELVVSCGYYDSKYWDNLKKYSQQSRKDDESSINEHAFTIEKFVKDNAGNIVDIIIINPWLSDMKIHKTLDEFMDQIYDISVVNEADNYDVLKEGFGPTTIKKEDIGL